MKDQTSEDKFFSRLFQDQRITEEPLVPVFSEVYGRAQTKHRKMERTKIAVSLAAGLLLLAGLTLITNHAAEPNEEIKVAKAGISLFDRLVNDGKIVTNDIHFAFDRAELKPESMSIIRSIGEMMKAHPEVRLSVEGHSDDQGKAGYNRELSAMRAEAVKQVLIDMGIAPDRLRSQGFGESRPVSRNDTEKGRAGNRRVEFVRF